MKTIKSFLLGTVLLLTSLGLITLSIKSFINANQLYQVYNTTEPIDLSYVFILTTIVSTGFAIVTFTLSFGQFQQFHTYYHKYLDGKRKRDIERQLLEAKYTKLHQDLVNAKSLEDKEYLINMFYYEDTTNKTKPVEHPVYKALGLEPATKLDFDLPKYKDMPWLKDNFFVQK